MPQIPGMRRAAAKAARGKKGSAKKKPKGGRPGGPAGRTPAGLHGRTSGPGLPASPSAFAAGLKGLGGQDPAHQGPDGQRKRGDPAPGTSPASLPAGFGRIRRGKRGDR